MADEKKAVDVKQQEQQQRRERKAKPRGGYKVRKDGQPRNLPDINRKSILRRIRNHIKLTYPGRPDATATLPSLLQWADGELLQPEWQQAPQEKKIKDLRQELYQARYRGTEKGIAKNLRRKAKAAAARAAARAAEGDQEGGQEGGEGGAAPA